MTDLLQEMVTGAQARMAELEPMVREYERLQDAVAKLNGITAPSTPRKRNGGAARRGRPPGSVTGDRAAEALTHVARKPGITVTELAETMGIGTTYLYRVMPALDRDGKVRKIGAGYHPA